MKRFLLAFLLVTVFIFSVTGCVMIQDHTVTYDTNGGSYVASQIVKTGETVMAPESPVKEGYTFAGWYLGEKAFNFSTEIDSDITLKAAWVLNSYDVTFDADGGSDVAAQKVNHGELVAAPAEPTKEGYAFAGWYLGETAYDFKAPVTGGITLKAAWAINVYDVTFDVDGGSDVAAQKVAHGAIAAIPVAPTKEGYAFAGWYLGETAYDFNAAVTGNVALKAKWTLNVYDVTFDADGGSDVAAQQVAHGVAVTAPAAPTKEGYTFAGWYLGETAYDFNTAVTGSIALKAKWTLNVYTVTFNSDGGSAVAAQKVNHGETATVPTAPKKAGYTFAGWFINGVVYNFKTPVTGDVTVKAGWRLNMYNVTFDSDGGSAVAAQKVGHGAKATVPAVPSKTGYAFAGWYLGETAYDFNTAVTGNITLKATWKINAYNVVFDSDGGSAVEAQVVNHGAKATAPAAPTKEGYTFAGWYVGATAYDFNKAVTGNVTLKAKWNVITYTVTFDSNGGSAVAAQTVNHGAAIASVNVTKRGYKLVGWTLNGEAYDVATPVTGDITLVAVWAEDIPDLSAIVGKWIGEENGTNYYEFVINADGTVTAFYENAYTTVTLQKNFVLFDGTTFTFNYSVSTSPEAKELVFTFSAQNQSLTTEAAVAGGALTVKKVYSVFMDSNGAGTNKNKTFEVAYGETLNEYKPTYTGHTLIGWFDEKGNAFDFSTPITADMTLTAKWEVKMLTLTFYAQDGTTEVKTIQVAYNTLLKDIADQFPTAISTTDGYKFNGKWYASLTATSPVNTASATTKITSDKAYYPGVIAPTNDIAGTWKGTDTKGNAFTVVINADQTVTVTVVNGETVTEYNVASIYYKNFNGTVKMVIRYTTAASTSESTLTLTAQEDGSFKGSSNSLVLQKEGVKTHTVTFDANGGSAVDPQTIVDGEKANEPTAPTMAGATFVGWYLGETKYDFETPVTGDITLTAKWEEIAVTYTVTFTNGSTTTTQEVAAGALAEAPADPTKSGKKFMGWFDGETKFDATAPITGDFNFVAKWGVEVTFYTQEKVEVKKLIVEVDTAIPANEIPTATVSAGFVFTGVWHKSYTTAAAPVDLTAPVTSTTKLYPGVIAESVTVLAGTWTGEKVSSNVVTEIDTFVIDVIYEDGKVIGVTVKTTVENVEDGMTTIYTPDQIASIQYNKSGKNMQLCIKYNNAATGSFSTFAINYTTDGTVKYGSSVILEKEAAKYTVTFDSAGGSEVDPQTVKEGSVAIAPEAPITTQTGVVFGGWYLGETKYDFTTPVTGDITLTAKWVESRNLTFYKQDGTKYVLAAEKGKTYEEIMTENYATIIAELTGVDKASVVTPASFEDIKTNIANALITIEGSYYIGMWHTSTTGATAVDFSTMLTANKNVAPAFLAPEVVKELEGTWTATKDNGELAGNFVTKIEVDENGKFLGVSCEATDENGKFDSIWIKTYTPTGADYKVIIGYQKTATKTSYFTLTKKHTTGAWQFSSKNLVKDDGSPKNFVVNFDSNGAAAVEKQTVVEGEKAAAPTAPTKEGFKFVGWYLDDAAYDFETPVTKTITLVAKWELDINTADVLGTWGCTIAEELGFYEVIKEYKFIFFVDGSVLATKTEEMVGYYTDTTEIDVLSLVKISYADNKIVICEKLGADEITLERKKILEGQTGTWTGIEDYAGLKIPYTFTIAEGGLVSGTYEMNGIKYQFSSATISNLLELDFMGAMKATLVFDGENLIGTGVMGGALTLTPYVEESDALTLEQIAGEWHGSEVFYEMTFNYVFVIKADGTGTAQYDSSAMVTVMTIESYAIENGKLVVNYNVDGYQYAPMTFSLVDGKLVGVGPMGTEITLEKQ